MLISTSHKGWLRQLLPQPKPHQLCRFIDAIDKQLARHNQPTDRQIQAARESAYRELMGRPVC